MTKHYIRGLLVLLSPTLLAGCGLGRTMAVQPNHSTHRPQPPRLVRIDMMSTKTGWALSATTLYHTQDGGKKWARVQGLPLPAKRLMPAQFAFVEARQAVMIYTQPNGTIDQEETFNSGRSWRRQTIASPFGNSGGSPVPTQITFQSPERGWLLLAPIQGMNSSTGALLATTNGGTTWTVTVKNTVGMWTPPLGRTTGMFTSPTQGWLMAATTSTTPATLYRTTDAGVHWQSELPWFRPSQNQPLIPPFPFGQQALLPSIQTSPTGIVQGLTLWRSDTGGASWIPNPNPTVLPAVLNNQDHWVHPDFVSLTTGWVAAPQGLLHTTDGGLHWVIQHLSPKEVMLPTTASIQTIQFFSTRRGDVFLATKDFRQEWLLFTTNGGTTWHVAFKGS